MARLPVVSAKDLIRALEKDGFVAIRQKGSHVVLQKKTLRSILLEEPD